MIKLDGTENKKILGANAILSVSLAAARAGAVSREQELFEYLHEIFGFQNKLSLPTPSFNIFNGGKHADTNLDFQEFMILPLTKIPFHEKVRMGAEIFHELAKVLKMGGFDTDVGAEGGGATRLDQGAGARMGDAQRRCVGARQEVGRSDLAAKEATGQLDRVDDLDVARAAAEVAAERPSDLGPRRGGVRLEQLRGRHDHAGDAEAALDGPGQHERLLDQVRPVGRAALALAIAGLLRPGQAKILADEVEQERLLFVHDDLHRVGVDGEGNLLHGSCPSAIWTAACRSIGPLYASRSARGRPGHRSISWATLHRPGRGPPVPDVPKTREP